jgi:hypothetical protein
MEYVPQVRKMAKAGCTELEIADVLGIDRSTLTDWQAKYAVLSRALELGKKQANKRVTRALYHRAIGYTHSAEKLFNDKGTVLRAETREHVPPDINAVKFWLTNRDPENWQDRSNLDVTGSLNVVASTLSIARQRLLAAKSTLPLLEGHIADDAAVQDASDAEVSESE